MAGWLLAAGLLVAQAAAQSSLYPSIDPTVLANGLNISIGCLDALNTTVACDATLLRMAGNVDNYMWDVDNVTALCSSDCVSSASAWFSTVGDQCANDLINVNGKLVPPVTVPGRVVDGLNIACLTAGTNLLADPGVNGSEWTSLTLSQVNSTAPVFDNSSDANVKRQLISTNSTSPFCLIESYSWTGSDIIRPDCSSGNNASQCSDPLDVPPENERLSNLYPDSLLCSDCFLKMYFLRVASPYLPDLDYSDYLISQWYDIVDVCGASMPDLLVRNLPYYDAAPGTYDGLPISSNLSVSSNSSSSISGNSTGGNSTSSGPGVSCGQTLGIAQLSNLTVANPNSNGSTFCEAISKQFNVTTGDIQLAFNDPFCLPEQNFTSVCVPAGCTLMQVPNNATCDSVAAQISNAKTNVTATQFETWNPNLQGLCDGLVPGQYVCISAPGGSYVSPPVSNSTTSDNSQQRGGGDGSTTTGNSTVTGPPGGGRNATTVSAGGHAPSPTQSGIAASCTEYAQAQASDGCESLSTLWQVSEQNFYAWNPILGPNGTKCDTEIFSGYYYCVGVQGSSTSTAAVSTAMPSATPTASASATPVSTGPASSAPSPTQSGIVSNCKSYAQAAKGDNCNNFAQTNKITAAQLYSWNPVLGSGGSQCDTEFQAGDFYCIGVSS